MILGTFWSQRDKLWIRFNEQDGEVTAEVAKISENAAITTEWQAVANGDWPVSYSLGTKDPIIGFYSLKKGILYSTDGLINKYSQNLTVSQRRDQRWYPVKINLVNYVKDDSKLIPYDALPLTPEMAAERKRVDQEEQESKQKQQAAKWKKYQDTDIHYRGMELSSANSLFAEQTQELLLDLLKTELFELDIKNYNCAEYLNVLKTIIEDPTNDSHQKINSLAATTDMDLQLGVGLPREELYVLKKSFYFDILRAEAQHLSQEFGIESTILDEKELARKNPPKISPRRIEVDIHNDDFENYWEHQDQNQVNDYGFDDQYELENGQDGDMQRAIASSLQNDQRVPFDPDYQRVLLESTVDEDSYTLIAIKDAVSVAQETYARWYKGGTLYKGGNDVRSENGFFTFFRHGSYGQGRATDLNNKILVAEDLHSAIFQANEFLRADSTNYHRHSFASFLLDELKKIKNSPWHGITYIENSKNLYDKNAVIEHLDRRLMISNIEI